MTVCGFWTHELKIMLRQTEMFALKDCGLWSLHWQTVESGLTDSEFCTQGLKIMLRRSEKFALTDCGLWSLHWQTVESALTDCGFWTLL